MTGPRTLKHEAEQALSEALDATGADHRAALARAIELAERAGAGAILARAHAARAEDARHGAGQLSLSAQRAPTLEACDEGWQRVEAIVRVAETSARAAAGLDPRAALRAAKAARDARRIVDERNHAYTFHTDGGFSFGEGWYVAAAGVLAGIAIQIEPAKPATSGAEHFLRAAGLGDRLQPYRSRPRAKKHTTALIARAFRADPIAAQQKLRAAFLGEAPIPKAIIEWVAARLSRRGKKILLWIRQGVHHAHRNTRPEELAALVQRSRASGLTPILIGDSAQGDLTLFWKDPVFSGIDRRRAQLQLFEHLKDAYGVVGQMGVTTAGMDGPALMGLPTVYLTDQPNVRMGEWVGAVPGYRELVREDGYLDRVYFWAS
jgi:hypothetical protein